MAEPSDSTDSTRGIFSADMTKLIAADSFVTGLGKPLMDPDAAQSFEILCTVLANDTLVYFQKPASFPEEPRPVMTAWKKVAEDLFRKGRVAKPAPAPPQNPTEVNEKCEKMVSSFAKYTRSARVTRQLIQWARFQFSDPELMVIFWDHNSEDELEIALNVLDRYEQIRPSFQAKFRSTPPIIDNVSALYLKKRSWKAEDFMIAYIFWAFAKGYRYAASLSSEHIYAVHWLREHAILADAQIRMANEEHLRGLFPWGHFLSDLIKIPEFHFDREDVIASILNLRDYTIKELPHTTNESSVHNFLREGLHSSLPRKLGAADYYGRLSWMASLVVGLWASWAGWAQIDLRFIAPSLQPIIKGFDLVIPTSAKSNFNQVGRQLRLLVYRSTISSIIEQHHQELIDYLNTRK